MTGLKITEYDPITTDLDSGDKFDVSKQISTGPSVWATQKYDWDDLISILSTTLTPDLSGYLPLTAGSSKKITGELYVNDFINFGNGTTVFGTAKGVSNSFSLGAQTGYSMSLASNGTEVIKLTSTELVGIGISSPTAKLNVKGSTGTPANKVLLVESGLDSESFYITESGIVNSKSAYYLGGSKAIFGDSTSARFFVGFDSGNITGSGNDVLGMGKNALTSFTSGSSLVGIGQNSLNANTSGSNNVAIGSYALSSNITGSNLTAIGYNSGLNFKGAYSTFIGSQITGPGVSQYLTIIGAYAGQNVGTGAQNTHIGPYTGFKSGVGNLSNTIILSNLEGYAMADRQCVIGSAEYDYRIDTFILGMDDNTVYTTTKATTYTIAVRPGTISGTDKNGYSIRYSGGKSTGAGTGGDFIIATTATSTTGSSLNSLVDRITVAGGTGLVAIGSSNPVTISSTGVLTATSPVFTSATLNGANVLAENAVISLDGALSADGKYMGITESGTAGAALAFGNLCYLNSSSKWVLTDANATSTAGDVKLGMCVLAAAGDGSATTILLIGKIRADSLFPTLTVGAPVYISETAGSIVVTAPTTTDVVVRRIGFANSADELYFNPSNDYFTHI